MSETRTTFKFSWGHLVLPLLFLILTGDQQKMLAELTMPAMLMMAVWVLIVPYGILGLVLRIRQLNNRLPV